VDLSSGFDLPNPYGLLASDFGYDVEGYSIALRFLSDLAGGTDEPDALRNNGGSIPHIRAWEANGKFRRVLAKCRQAGARERAAAAERKRAEAEAVAEPAPSGNRFIPIDEVPRSRSIFARQASAASWGR
jgi:hypothetical protein